MKLLAKYNRIYTTATIIILSVSGIFYYFLIRYQLISQLDKDLQIEELEIIENVRLNHTLPNASNYKDQSISFTMIDNPSIKRQFVSKQVYNPEENKWETTREISFPIVVAGSPFNVTVSKSQQETDELIQLILLITFFIVVSLLTALFFINRFLLSKLWRPFTTTLQQLKLFNLAGQTDLQFEKTSIDEIADLNNAVSVMSKKVSKDYQTLKSFTENASHEIQTPLAVIQSKLELLIQSENLHPEHVRSIQSVYDACIRLSRLNQSLILLTKIDNQQFQEKEHVNVATLVREQLRNYEELIEIKQIQTTCTLEEACWVEVNNVMAGILLSNLLTNAIKHNVENGMIDILLTKQQLSISNSGAALKTDPAELFDRFKKDDQGSDSLGLGLSIVKKIGDQNNFIITYTFVDKVHTVTVLFN